MQLPLDRQAGHHVRSQGGMSRDVETHSGITEAIAEDRQIPQREATFGLEVRLPRPTRHPHSQQ